MVSLETLETQPLLDHADTSLDFVTRKDIIPISIERLNGEFLLHYTDFSFFVNRNGWRARSDWVINWEGRPQTFALSHPYLLAFEPNFIEIRQLETSQLVHIITAKNIRMLHSSTREASPYLLDTPRPNRTKRLTRFCTLTRMMAAKTLSQAWTFGASHHNNARSNEEGLLIVTNPSLLSCVLLFASFCGQKVSGIVLYFSPEHVVHL